MRPTLGEVLDRSPDAIADDKNLLNEGLDSLRVMDFLSEVSRTVGVTCSPAEFMSTPTLRGFMARLGERIAGSPEAASGAQQLVTLNDAGKKSPMFCFHPAGGQVTAYLRLRSLLGDDQPLYAIQTRAAKHPETEYPSLQQMADDYARLIAPLCQGRPCKLLGWSMGGLIAQAVAVALELSGNEVESVNLIDPATGGQRDWGDSDGDDLALALKGVIYELVPSFDRADALDAALAVLKGREPSASELKTWCEEQGFVPTSRSTLEEFAALFALRKHHQRMVVEHEARAPHHAPITVWWAKPRSVDWAQRTRAAVNERVIGGTHFTVMQPPLIERIAAELVARDKSS
jgi:thioesterase domain-containing protein/aryl carrier-like protein